MPEKVRTAFYNRKNAPNVRWISKLMMTAPQCVSNWHDVRTKNAYLLQLVGEFQKYTKTLWTHKRHFVLRGHEKDWRYHFFIYDNTTSDEDVSKFKHLIGKSNFETFVIYEKVRQTNYLLIHGPLVDMSTVNTKLLFNYKSKI